MIIKAKSRGFICTSAHPRGCYRNVEEQIAYVKKQGPLKNGPQKALIIGASTGYGLASRIVAAFGYRASTLGVFSERPAENNRTASAGWYNSVAFERLAREEGLYSYSVNGDAFSDEIKKEVLEKMKKDWGKVDLIVYSLAAPRRMHPKTGKLAKSVLKPTRGPFSEKSIDFSKSEIIQVTLDVAQQSEIDQAVSVMGGEDWKIWIDSLNESGLLAEGFLTVAYSYLGPRVTRPIYRYGTIGVAKEHLEATAKQMNAQFKSINGRALVSVNKALLTQSSSAIPFVTLYLPLLKKVMKQKGLDEDCIQQMQRLFNLKLYNGSVVPVDDQGRIRLDDRELQEDVQLEVEQLWKQVNSHNLHQIFDMKGYQEDFLKLFGFGIPGVDYDADINPDIPLF